MKVIALIKIMFIIRGTNPHKVLQTRLVSKRTENKRFQYKCSHCVKTINSEIKLSILSIIFSQKNNLKTIFFFF